MAKPPKVESASKNPNDPVNAEFLKKAGSKGGQVTAKRRDVRKAASEDIRERKLAEDQQMDREANYHIITPDGKDLSEDE